MARIRTLKPDFMDSGSTRKLSRDARLFFLQLLTEADDEGRLKDSPKKLAGVLYPGDEDVEGSDIARWIDECQGQDMILRYTVEGEKYLAISNFLTHQKISHPTASKLPEPSDADEDTTSDQGSCDPPDLSGKTPEASVSLQEKPPEEKEVEREKEREVEREVPNSLPLVAGGGFFQNDPKVIQNHAGHRERAVTDILNKATSLDGKALTPRERKQLRSQVNEWLVAGYEADAISAAITASPFKTPNAVGGQLRKQQPQQSANWNNLGAMYEEALRKEQQ